MEEDNWILGSLKYNCNWTWQLELPDGYSNGKEQPKMQEDVAGREGGRGGRKQEVETQEQIV
jgi:hypothetical protein